KTTLAMLMARLIDPDGGTVRFMGEDVFSLPRAGLKSFRRAVQMVFQDPFASLNPRMKVGSIVAEGMVIHRLGDRSWRSQRVSELLSEVGLSGAAMDKYPHEFSGGQRQRIGIARALAVEPRVVLADEPVSALDVSVQAKVLNLLLELKAKRYLTYLIIAHDLQMVGQIADTIAVMYLGKLMEVAPARSLFAGAMHPYTRLLLASIPKIGSKPTASLYPARRVDELNGQGCRFRNRCSEAVAECTVEEPRLIEVGREWQVACHRI
ncbi:MAG: ABC transporter ATP-binding protein, partial [Candidatus Coatesbacteria bacterium]|nr:ABC transporter ATP-binding protein [Candidatus Coatesbacteria bacterium]